MRTKQQLEGVNWDVGIGSSAGVEITKLPKESSIVVVHLFVRAFAIQANRAEGTQFSKICVNVSRMLQLNFA